MKNNNLKTKILGATTSFLISTVAFADGADLNNIFAELEQEIEQQDISKPVKSETDAVIKMAQEQASLDTETTNFKRNNNSISDFSNLQSKKEKLLLELEVVKLKQEIKKIVEEADVSADDGNKLRPYETVIFDEEGNEIIIDSEKEEYKSQIQSLKNNISQYEQYIEVLQTKINSEKINKEKALKLLNEKIIHNDLNKFFPVKIKGIGENLKVEIMFEDTIVTKSVGETVSQGYILTHIIPKLGVIIKDPNEKDQLVRLYSREGAFLRIKNMEIKEANITKESNSL